MTNMAKYPKFTKETTDSEERKTRKKQRVIENRYRIEEPKRLEGKVGTRRGGLTHGIHRERGKRALGGEGFTEKRKLTYTATSNISPHAKGDFTMSFSKGSFQSTKHHQNPRNEFAAGCRRIRHRILPGTIERQHLKTDLTKPHKKKVTRRSGDSRRSSTDTATKPWGSPHWA